MDSHPITFQGRLPWGRHSSGTPEISGRANVRNPMRGRTSGREGLAETLLNPVDVPTRMYSPILVVTDVIEAVRRREEQEFTIPAAPFR